VDWYGDGKRSLDICTATALWYRSGSDPLPIRWVLTRDPEAQRPPIALFSTDQSQPAEEIVTDAHEALEPGDDVRRKPGVFRHRNTETMVFEPPPLLFGLYSLIALFGHALHPDGGIPVAQAAWYRKLAATIRDVLAAVRRQLWSNSSFPTSASDPDVVSPSFFPSPACFCCLLLRIIVQSRAQNPPI